jgi:toxin ParE1/3/4
VTSLIVRPEAESDIYEAYAYYEARSAGLGEMFLDSIESALQSIRDNPRRFPEVLRDPHESVRRALTKRFPFGIYFVLRESEQLISVIACMHARQEPGRWIRRVL